MRGRRAGTSELLELAHLFGVQPSYRRFEGRQHRVDPDVIVAVLGALGVGISGPQEAPEALAAEQAARSARVLEPVFVRRIGDRADSPLRVPPVPEPERCWLTVALEDGRSRTERLDRLLGKGGLTLPLPDDVELPPGYHELRLEGPGLIEEALLLAAPRCPVPEREWGIFSPLSSLRSESDWGAGSYTELVDFGRWVRSRGGGFVATLPLYPAFLDEPADPSPYLPVTRLGYSELYVDPNAVPELAQAPDAMAVLRDPSFTERVRKARAEPLTPYEELASLRRQVLEPLAVALIERGGEELRRFATARPELLAYARFRAVAERDGRDRRHWSDRSWADLASLSLEDAGVGYHLCGQWLADRQLAEAARVAPLYGDMPVGVHPDGFDPVFAPEAFATRAHGGAPPDAFYATGQDWSFPPLHPLGLREQRYRYLIDVFRVAFAHASVVRIDHVMGLHRMYWIPEGYDATHGAYVAYAPDELHALVAIEAERRGAVVVGEDLGTVDPSVRKAMARERMLRSWVLQFESSVKDPLPDPPSRCLASFGTHDTPRFAGFFRGATAGEPNRIEDLLSEHPPREKERASWRRALAQALDIDEPSPKELASTDQAAAERAALAGCLVHLAASRADLVAIDLGDLLGELDQVNRPGTLDAANWRRRALRTMEEIQDDPGVGELVALVDGARRAGVNARSRR